MKAYICTCCTTCYCFPDNIEPSRCLEDGAMEKWREMTDEEGHEFMVKLGESD